MVVMTLLQLLVLTILALVAVRVELWITECLIMGPMVDRE